MIGLATVVALVLTALFGAGSASATVLCSENAGACPAEKTYASGTTIEATLKSGTNFLIEGTLNEKCTGSTLKGKSTSKVGAPLSMEVTSVTISGCGESACPSGESLNLPYAGSVQATEAGNGSVTLQGGGSGNPALKFTSCFWGSACKFSASSLPLTLTGGNPATLVAKKAPLTLEEGSKFFCGETGKLSATYEITAPKPVFASHAAVGTVLCSKGLVECLPENTYAKGTEIKSTLSGSLKYQLGIFGNVSCTGSTMTLASTAEIGTPLAGQLTGMSFTGCEPCKKMALVSPPYKASFEATGGGSGTLTTPLVISWSECSLGVSCKFGSTSVTLDVEGGTTAHIQFKEEALHLEEGNSSQCGTSTTLTGTYEVTSPKGLWLLGSA
jgi:hypothetical protein